MLPRTAATWRRLLKGSGPCPRNPEAPNPTRISGEKGLAGVQLQEPKRRVCLKYCHFKSTTGVAACLQTRLFFREPRSAYAEFARSVSVRQCRGGGGGRYEESICALMSRRPRMVMFTCLRSIQSSTLPRSFCTTHGQPHTHTHTHTNISMSMISAGSSSSAQR